MSINLSPDGVSQELCDFLHDTLRQPVQVDDDIFALGMANSMFALELIVYIESRYGLTLEGEDLTRDNFRSAQAMSQLVMRRSAAVGDE
ncbi:MULTISPECIES: acyl carrier protein [unclassified Streptomyces]|uniref:acyl carrier protein n=1 Tax=unclassified Streptomyces TaxID=2593676 RepID=UPI001BE86739|nr:MULTISPECIES: acyl carrier protein [unclassified Streptomyces]MBT2408586.1 acyl carrier protein [Streptomyces sp. ISL-21]MBT2458183.1 acyl carrier protein [Streptomyces sp. ISL-86]MBT2608730.1 acyl carrier protein [Streptomyces sp. ISL-87]